MSDDTTLLNPETYFELLRKCSIGPVVLRQCEAVHQPVAGTPLPRLRLVETMAYERLRPDAVVLVGKFTLSGRQARQLALRLSATWQVVLLASAPLPDEFAEQYARLNLPFNLWPFWRHWAVSTAADMGLPPLVIPLRLLGQGEPVIEFVTQHEMA